MGRKQMTTAAAAVAAAVAAAAVIAVAVGPSPSPSLCIDPFRTACLHAPPSMVTILIFGQPLH